MKLLIHLKSLASRGGAERAMLNLASALVERGHDVTISVCQPTDLKLAYPVPDTLKLVWLRAHPVPWYLQPLNRKKWLCQRALKRHIADNDYDVILGWLRYGASKVGQLPRSTKAPRMSALRNIPYGGEASFKGRIKGQFMYWLRRPGLTRSDKIFLQMPQFYDMLPQKWQEKTAVIPNAVLVPETSGPDYSSREKLIVAVARLVPVKRLDDLIRGFALFHQKFPDWRLEIWGQNGPMGHRQLLDKLIDSNGLQDSVGLMGVTQNVEEVYARARIMAHPSQREGMSNSVTEAMARALPTIVSADCKGMDSLISDGENGVMLAGGNGAQPLHIQIAEALSQLASDPEHAAGLGQKARQTMQEKFAPSVIYDLWEKELFGPAHTSQTTRAGHDT